MVHNLKKDICGGISVISVRIMESFFFTIVTFSPWQNSMSDSQNDILSSCSFLSFGNNNLNSLLIFRSCTFRDRVLVWQANLLGTEKMDRASTGICTFDNWTTNVWNKQLCLWLVFWVMHYPKILQLRVKFQTAMVSCFRFVVDHFVIDHFVMDHQVVTIHNDSRARHHPSYPSLFFSRIQWGTVDSLIFFFVS